MNADTQVRENSLEYDLQKLSEDLASSGSALSANVTISTYPHIGGYESYVSQSDFGFVLEYENTLSRRASWSVAYLMQAKRLFKDADAYTLSSEFGSLSSEQHERIQDLAEILGEEALRYWLYLPQPTAFDRPSMEAIRGLHDLRLDEQIYDFALGLAFYEWLKSGNGCNAGMWISESSKKWRYASDVHQSAFVSASPFTWFILDHFNQSRLFHTRSLLRAPGQGSQTDRVRKIAEGDQTEARELINQLGEKARRKDYSIENAKVLPKNTVTISIRSGPDVGADLLQFGEFSD